MKEVEGMFFVLHATEKRSSLSLGFGEIIDGDLVVYSKENPPQKFQYNEENGTIYRNFTTYNGEDG
ncbi:MAG: hypothetical protein GWN00_00170, partial [Aliifodinibius sp.]|nr:hypothetical protein [Phycisphaerae bacterium]NIT54698.1 hypothetical protein [Fodinibius sp.]NIW97582.1 hypothetical protein [Phycisphaerae bacterium]NIY23282.1 hypothetical protein [Fodinibius sp.]